jgi:NTP pyrophosphatase (non-canonical NTP hydrolase)
MNFNDYQSKALESVAITDRSVAALAHRTLGLTGEAGVVGNAVKKAIRDKQGKLDAGDVQLLKEKLGDTLYYISALAEYADIELDDIATANLEKSANFKQSRNL